MLSVFIGQRQLAVSQEPSLLRPSVAPQDVQPSSLGDYSSVHPGNDALCRPRVLCVGWAERLLKDRLLNVNPIADRD